MMKSDTPKSDALSREEDSLKNEAQKQQEFLGVTFDTDLKRQQNGTISGTDSAQTGGVPEVTNFGLAL